MKKWIWVVIIAIVLLLIGYTLMNKESGTNTDGENTGNTGGAGTPDPAAGGSTSDSDFAAIDNAVDNLG